MNMIEWIDRKTYWPRVWLRKHIGIEYDKKSWGIGIAWVWDRMWFQGLAFLIGPFEFRIGRVRG